jgi:hypothetical protein
MSGGDIFRGLLGLQCSNSGLGIPTEAILARFGRLAQSFWHRPRKEVTWTFPPTE